MKGAEVPMRESDRIQRLESCKTRIGPNYEITHTRCCDGCPVHGYYAGARRPDELRADPSRSSIGHETRWNNHQPKYSDHFRGYGKVGFAADHRRNRRCYWK